MSDPQRPLSAAERAAVANVQRLTTVATEATKAERDRIAADDAAVRQRVAEAQVRAVIGEPYPPGTADEFRTLTAHHLTAKAAVYRKGAEMVTNRATDDPDELLDLARAVERAAHRVDPQGVVGADVAERLPAHHMAARAKEQELLGTVMQYPETLRALRVMDPDRDFSHHGHVASAITSLADRKEAFGPDAVAGQLKTMNVRQPVERRDGTTQLHDWADAATLPIHGLMAAEDLRTIRIARETEGIGQWLQQSSREALDVTGARLTESLGDVQERLQEKLSALPPRLDLTSWDLINHPKTPEPGANLALPERPEWMRQQETKQVRSTHRVTIQGRR